VNWLYYGYFFGWYALLGLGFAAWLDDPANRASWGMVAFGTFAYFVVIPGLLFRLLPVFSKLSAGADSVVQEGLARGSLSRGYAFAVGLESSLMAIVTCAVAYGVAAMETDVLQPDRLGETGLAVAMVSILVGILAVIAACPWLGRLLLLRKCRLTEVGARGTWSWRIAPIVVALAWAGTVGWLGYRLANATSVMTARLDFAALPASDEPLQERLRSQPGVIGAAVSREGNTVVVECALSPYGSHTLGRWGDTVWLEYTTLAGDKLTLDLARAATDVGYRGLTGATFDRPRSRW
jgi:hypothetical protein